MGVGGNWVVGGKGYGWNSLVGGNVVGGKKIGGKHCIQQNENQPEWADLGGKVVGGNSINGGKTDFGGKRRSDGTSR